MIDLHGTTVTIDVGGVQTAGVVCGVDEEARLYVVRYTLEGGGTGTLSAPLDVVAPRVAATSAVAHTGATQALASQSVNTAGDLWHKLAYFVRQHPLQAGLLVFALVGAMTMSVIGAESQPSPAPLALQPTPTLTLAEKAYARTLTEQREAYAEPDGAFLGAVEAGRGYAPLAGNVPGWEYVDVAGAGAVWLLVPTAVPDVVAVEAVVPTAVPVAPQVVVEYVPVPVAPPAPAAPAAPALVAPEAERRQPDAALMERVRVGDPPAVNVIR